jgi:hypothetical protein
MSLEDRLARRAARNANDISIPEVRSDEATVVGYDKVTGQHIVKRAGAREVVNSATSGVLKPGVNVPAIQGQAFATPHVPRKKPLWGAPQIAKEVEHKVFLAVLPGRIYTDMPWLGSPYFVRDGGRDGEYSYATQGGFAPSSPPLESSFLGEGDEIASDGHTLLTKSEKSYSYKIFKAVIDGMFPATEGQGLTSEVVLSSIGIGQTGNTVIRTPGLQYSAIGIQITGSGATDEIRDGGVFVIETGRSTDETEIPAFFLKRILTSALKAKGKTLIVVLCDRLLPKAIPFYESTDAISQSYLNAFDRKLRYLQRDLVTRLFGVCLHGRYESGQVYNSNGYTQRRNSSLFLGGSGGASYELASDYYLSSGWSPGYIKATKKEIPYTRFPAKNSKEFALLRQNISELPSSLYVSNNYYFSSINKKDPLQAIYGDSETPHFFIKGISEEYVAAIDVVAEADAAGIPKALQYTNGLDIDPYFLPYKELGQPPQP